MKTFLTALFLAALALPAQGQPPDAAEVEATIKTVERIAAGPAPTPVADALGVVPGWAWALSAVPAIYALRRLHQVTNPPEEKR